MFNKHPDLERPFCHRLFTSLIILTDYFGLSALLMVIWNYVFLEHISGLTAIGYWHAFAMRIGVNLMIFVYNASALAERDVYRNAVVKYLQKISNSGCKPHLILGADLEAAA
jgi:hypothetical protein